MVVPLCLSRSQEPYCSCWFEVDIAAAIAKLLGVAEKQIETDMLNSIKRLQQEVRRDYERLGDHRRS